MGKRGTPRASCDPCRRKKVKCDKDQRNAEGISLCSFCTARGYDCIITDDARPNRPDESDNDATSGADNASKKKRKKSDAQDGGPMNGATPSRPMASFDPAGAGPGQDTFVTPGPAMEPDMLNVRGLTRAILDDAVASHFRTTYWCNPAVHPRHFYPRYRRYLSKLDGVASSSTDYDTFPPTDILILAVACVGVVQLGYASQRFDLQARIYRRLEKLVSQACTKDITVSLDVLEAILLTFDVPARNKAVEEATTSSIDAGFVHPMSHTKMIRLLTHHGLNRSKEDPVVKAKRLKHSTPERRILCEVNDERMPLILAVAATNDIIRSFDMFDRHQLLQEDIDPDAMMADLGGPIGNQWAWQLSVMASVLRTNNLTICAAKSRRMGIPPSAILEVLMELERFERQIPEALKWNTSAGETHGATLRQLIPHDNTSEDIISILVRKAFLSLLLWSQYRCIHTLVQAHGLQRPVQGTRLDGSVYLRARQRLDSLLLTALDRMSEICPQLASISVPPSFAFVNLLDYSSIAFRSSIKGGAYYTLEIAKLTFKSGLHELTADLLSKAGRMIYAFSTYQCHPDTQAEAARMRKILSSLYTEFEMIPGLGTINDAKLQLEREQFSSVFEPAAAFQDSAMPALVSDVTDMQWNNGGGGAGVPSAPMSSVASWSTPGTDDLATFGGSMNDFLAGLPFVNAAIGPASASPHPVPFTQKTPASTTTTGASPFDLNAFLETHIEPNAVPNARETPSNY
ncbi:uncharacterized protein UTRI_02081_B [Ustilago trichophora]|uniref:Zn(2)-C6 fungal-type domain-containing protein n=1 Tax=Ustilago trichophora TaxID=86804 RepID=A0A5C3DYA9_9BASI|nr:uncharacterized protein UTRI_02081_B [Ustilago trichophora]